MNRVTLFLFMCVGGAGHSISADEPSDPLSHQVFEAANTSVGLINRTSATFLERRNCFTCHTQTLAALVLTDAAKAGIDIDEQNLQSQVDRAYEIYDSLGGVRPDTVGHALFALDIGKTPPNAKIEAMLRYLLDYGKETGHWKVAIENREPAESSDFTTNYLAVRAANRYGTADLQGAISVRMDAVRKWFSQTNVQTTEDQVFRLFLSKELDMPDPARAPFVRRLLDEQRTDGGWAQREGMDPDAYATASVLVALHQAGGVPTDDEQWTKGIEYLLETQQSDGSWYVKSRAIPDQKYFESGFPHGKDQFISAFATGWATEALLLRILNQSP